MENKFLGQKGLKCVVLCGGMGTRMFPLTQTKQKTMLQVKQNPLLRYVIDYWSQFTKDFIFVASYKHEQVLSFVKDMPICHESIVEADPRGIANAILLAKDSVSESFIVVLGDCICHGEFLFPKNLEQGVGVWRTSKQEDIKRSYSISLAQSGVISDVIEKPEQLINDLCGMGFYFFNRKVFDYIKITEPSARSGKVEITDVIRKMIKSGEKVLPVFFEGEYLNVTYSEDLQNAERILNKK